MATSGSTCTASWQGFSARASTANCPAGTGRLWRRWLRGLATTFVHFSWRRVLETLGHRMGRLQGPATTFAEHSWRGLDLPMASRPPTAVIFTWLGRRCLQGVSCHTQPDLRVHQRMGSVGRHPPAGSRRKRSWARRTIFAGISSTATEGRQQTKIDASARIELPARQTRDMHDLAVDHD
jgi:hypothetical protein